ncbi:MAG: TetR/AcrR family transcriptional regulator [Gammaproteobacteria bacterium]|nr:TetR/AcrR family transcriptional regulator [Gammaproteobacteria bacterium]
MTSLQLFNEFGEPNTTTNDIADETDISPGNLHYHFRKKNDLVNALLSEFQADARKVLIAPAEQDNAIDEFWGYLHLLLETLTAYRFLYRDIETLMSTYPQVGRALQGFSKGLQATFKLHIDALRECDVLQISAAESRVVCRNLGIVALFSERYDLIAGQAASADVVALRIADAVLSILLPYSTPAAAPLLQALSEQYRA